MRHNLSYRDWLESSNAEVAFVRANFTGWTGTRLGGRPGTEIGNRGNACDFTFNRSLVILAQ